jgi:hypothetical protein
MKEVIEYFKNSWQQDFSKFTFSGWELLNRIDANESILDVGCGYNPFKKHFKNVYGIDPAIDAADELTSIDDFVSDKKWDVVLVLGSLNFGTKDLVKSQVEKAVHYCKSGGRIYWRQNPGDNDHPYDGIDTITFFGWTFEDNYEWAKEFGCKIVEVRWDTGNRIYAEWKKL